MASVGRCLECYLTIFGNLSMLLRATCAVIRVNDREDARLITAGFQDSTSHVHGAMAPSDADELQPREKVCPPWRSRGQISNGTLTIPGSVVDRVGRRTYPPYAGSLILIVDSLSSSNAYTQS
jgi:hypothetical protein